MPTKAVLEAQNKELQEQIAEAKRQVTNIPVTIEDKIDGKAGEVEPEGSHAIDHLTILDNHREPDTNLEGTEVIEARNSQDFSFWNNSWHWNQSKNSYGNKPEDRWFINPTSKLIGEVMRNAPTIYSACEVALMAGDHQEQLTRERKRHLEFLREADTGDLVSESLDLLTSYQGRFLESVQRYIGLVASYDNQRNAEKPDQERLESAKMRKHDAGAQCRAWSARLIALVEAYHSVVTDERAYRLSYNFAPMPPKDDATPPTREYSLFKWSVTNTLNRVGRRLTRSVKTGKMDAERYRIPRPWMTETQTNQQLNADDLIGDFN